MFNNFKKVGMKRLYNNDKKNIEEINKKLNVISALVKNEANSEMIFLDTEILVIVIDILKIIYDLVENISNLPEDMMNIHKKVIDIEDIIKINIKYYDGSVKF
jgi:hypothetical protein